MKRKEIIAELKILESRENGGKIRINTPAVDRDKDRVYPEGAVFENYLKNPVVLWGHNYRDAANVIGRTNSIERSADYIDVDFELRPAANESDPQNIVLLLWAGNWVKTASIGFYPIGENAPNEVGGVDYRSWELLEWSLIPVPSNQEALRLAVKGLDVENDEQNLTGSDSDPKKADIPEGTITTRLICDKCDREYKASWTLAQEIFNSNKASLCEDCVNDDLSAENDQDDTTIINNATISENDGTLDVHTSETDDQEKKQIDQDETEPTNDDPPNDERSDDPVKLFFEKLNQTIRSLNDD